MDQRKLIDRLADEIEAGLLDQARDGGPGLSQVQSAEGGGVYVDGVISPRQLAEHLEKVFVLSVKGEVIDQSGPGDD